MTAVAYVFGLEKQKIGIAFGCQKSQPSFPHFPEVVYTRVGLLFGWWIELFSIAVYMSALN